MAKAKMTVKRLAKTIKDKFNPRPKLAVTPIENIEIVGGRFLVVKFSDGTSFDITVDTRE